jgi:hypothetical protein
MIVLNYAHPLTPEQLEQVATLTGAAPQVRAVAVQADRTRPLAEVARELADAAGLSAAEWQTLDLAVNPPGLAPLALALAAEIHGRRGDFPAILNVRPVVSGATTRYEVGEIINLQALRLTARERREG